jgi:hypothetical protein
MEESPAGEMAHLARRPAHQGALCPHVTVDESADLPWVLTSFDGFDLL